MPMTSRRLLRTALPVVGAWLLAGAAAGATLPAGFVESPVAAGLGSPTAMAFAPDGRLFVCEQGGALRVVKGGLLLPTPFVTLTVDAQGERGLLGVAFDPDFTANHYVYVYYTAATPTIHNRVSRFTADGDQAVAGSEAIVLELETLGPTNHNGGAIHFGPDGKLYVAVGDNANGSNAQRLDNRLGKILRIDPDGAIPPDNPLLDVTSGPNQAIWALGLRNPFTFAFEPLFGAMLIDDVGQAAWEEIDVGAAGANYGWPDTEGPTADPRYQGPLYAYTHTDGCALSGGAFHSFLAPQFPFEYWGAYFFADYCGGWIRARRLDGVVVDFASGIASPVDLQMAGDGSLYYLARGGGAASGSVARIAYDPPGPVVDVSANGADGPVAVAAGSPLQIDLAFATGGGGPLPAGELYVAVLTPFGLYWLDASGAFVPVLARAYAGGLPAFGPSPLLRLRDVAGLPHGVYLWMILADGAVDGVPAADYSDFVLTTVS